MEINIKLEKVINNSIVKIKFQRMKLNVKQEGLFLTQ
jgi:hypothetical protein